MADEGESIDAELDKIERLVRMLDESIPIPGTRHRVGLDAIVGLLPGAGDLVMALLSLWIVYRGRRLGARLSTVGRMLWNVLIDSLVGTVPLAGDIFDAWWKANRRNLELLRGDLGRSRTG